MSEPSPPEEMVIDIDYLTGAEIIEIEDLADMPFDKMGDPDQKKGRLLVAIATIIKRRTEPGFTFEDAGNLRIRLNEEVDPTGPDEKPG